MVTLRRSSLASPEFITWGLYGDRARAYTGNMGAELGPGPLLSLYDKIGFLLDILQTLA